jgi:hypothetical protein
MENFCSEFGRNRTKSVDSARRKLFTPLSILWLSLSEFLQKSLLLGTICKGIFTEFRENQRKILVVDTRLLTNGSFFFTLRRFVTSLTEVAVYV